MELEQGFPLNKHFQPERILLPRFDTLGDLVLLEGLVGMLQQRFPRARITLLIRRPYADLSALFPLGLDWLVTEVDPHREPPDLSSCRNLLSDLHGTDWDLLLVTVYNRAWADDFVAASLPQTERIAFGHCADMPETLQKVFAGMGLRTECPYEHFVSVREDSLETAKYQAMWQALGEESILPEPELFISEYQKAAVEHILRMAGMEPKHFCLCFPAGTRKVGIKVWPPDRLADVIAWLEKERGIRALIAGHRSEMACIEEVLRLAGDRGAKPGKWVGREGELPILAALAESAGFYLGNDTGPMHIAAAVRTPVIGIFGDGTWPRFIPRRDKSIVIAGEMPCFGCGWNCVFGDAPCMSLVTTKDLKQAIGDLLGEAGISGFRILKGSNRLSMETERFIEKASKTFRVANDDRLARLEANLRLEKLLAESEADRAARLAEIERLEKLLEECEADHTARLAEMERLGKQLAESEADRAARLAEMERLGRQIAESESGRTALLAKTERLERIRNSNWVKIFLKLGLIREEGSSNKPQCHTPHMHRACEDGNNYLGKTCIENQ